MESKTQRTKSEQRDTTVCHYFGTTGRKRKKNHAHYKTPTKAKEKGVYPLPTDTRPCISHVKFQIDYSKIACSYYSISGAGFQEKGMNQ